MHWPQRKEMSKSRWLRIEEKNKENWVLETTQARLQRLGCEGPLAMQWDLGTSWPTLVVVDRNHGSAPVTLFTLPTAELTNERNGKETERQGKEERKASGRPVTTVVHENTRFVRRRIVNEQRRGRQELLGGEDKQTRCTLCQRTWPRLIAFGQSEEFSTGKLDKC